MKTYPVYRSDGRLVRVTVPIDEPETDTMKDFQPIPDPKPVLQDDALYLGDNGRCFCGKHAGTTAYYTGRDLSGQKVLRVTPEMAAEAKRPDGFELLCETCRPFSARSIDWDATWPCESCGEPRTAKGCDPCFAKALKKAAAQLPPDGARKFRARIAAAEKREGAKKTRKPRRKTR